MLQYSIISIDKDNRDCYYVTGDYANGLYKLYKLTFMPGNVVKVGMSELYFEFFDTLKVHDFTNVTTPISMEGKIVLVAHSMDNLVGWFNAMGFQISMEGLIHKVAAESFLSILNKKRSTLITFPPKK